MFPMYVNKERVMVLSYKPKIDDVIKDDKTSKWYKVLKVEGRTVQARKTMGLGY
ncbi:hypothetical protein ABKP09_20005 [Peribacillus frigoritolerans]|uniref:hypothetical protein n=1 Tax=Peribacillus frigoritolerans TaxID=450367 RepID=UPI0032B35635